MAKGNLFQGMGRGKIGDVVLSRLNGQQVSRVRNRQPTNPKTNAQLYQRAIMATVMRAYSAGKEIFDHSFEGKKVGSGCQAEFMSLNAKALRSQIAAEVAAGYTGEMQAANLVARVCAPGLKVPVPNKYIVSDGTLVNDIMDNAGGFLKTPDENGETADAYFTRCGFTKDTLLTLVGFFVSDVNLPKNVAYFWVNNFGGKLYYCNFYWLQIRPKAALFGDTQTQLTEATKLTTVFDYTGNRIPLNMADLDFSMGLSDAKFVSDDAPLLGTSGVIYSRENSGLRSKCVLDLYDDHDQEDQEYGLTSDYLIDVWSQKTESVGDSDLILEGSGF